MDDYGNTPLHYATSELNVIVSKEPVNDEFANVRNQITEILLQVFFFSFFFLITINLKILIERSRCKYSQCNW